MSRRVTGLGPMPLAALLLLLSPAFTCGAEPQRAAAPARPETAPAESMRAEGSAATLEGLVGTVVAADPGTGTIVVDVPLEKHVLRVGAWITAATTFSGAASLGDVKPGARVRIDIRRVERGDELIGLDVLGGSGG